MPAPKRTSALLAETLRRLERQRLQPAPSNPIIKAVQDDIVSVAELNNSTVALCRSTLEEALKLSVPAKLITG